MNIVVLVGRLTREAELRYTQQGTPVADFTVAVDRRPGPDGEHETDFVPVVAWGKLAENCAQHLVKGQRAGVEGRLQVRTYEKDGQKRRAVEVVAEDVRFLDKPRAKADDEAAAANE